MRTFPFLNLRQSVILLRYSLALVFLSHAIVRIYNGTIPDFGLFLENRGLIYGQWIVWAITVFEIAGSIVLAAGFLTRWLSAAFILLLLTGIILIHAQLGWFVGEHGTGGSEYSFILIICLVLIAAAGPQRATPSDRFVNGSEQQGTKDNFHSVKKSVA